MLFPSSQTIFEPESTTYWIDRFEVASSVSGGSVEHLRGEVVGRVGCLVTDISDLLLLPRRAERAGALSGPLDYIWGLAQTRQAGDGTIRAESPQETMARLAAEQGGKAFGEHVRKILESGIAQTRVFGPTDEFPFWEHLYLLEQVPDEALPVFDS